MTNEPKNVPELRFPEFEEEWVEKKLGEIGEFCKSYSFSRAKEGNGKVKHIHYGDIHSKFESVLSSDKDIPNIDENKEMEFIQKGDLVFADASEDYKDLGRAIMINFEPNFIVSGLHTHLFRPFNINLSSFFIQFTKTNQYHHFIQKEGNGISVLGISKKNLGKLNLYIPYSSEEQQKIGNFFSKLDDQIELEERKLELLEQQKKGYMQKIFSQELRFKDENGDDYPEWESKKIKELFNIIDGDRGKNYPSEKDFCYKGHTLFLDTGNVTKKGFSFYTNRFIDKEKDDMLRNGKLELNDFVITSRGTLGNIGFYDQNIHYKYPNIRINSAMLILRPLNIKFDNQYLYFLLKDDAIAMFMKQYRVGSAQPHITKKDFGNMKTNVITNINEQRKIAQFLTIIDKLVIKQCNKVRLLKQRKQGLLQKMFI